MKFLLEFLSNPKLPVMNFQTTFLTLWYKDNISHLTKVYNNSLRFDDFDIWMINENNIFTKWFLSNILEIIKC